MWPTIDPDRNKPRPSQTTGKMSIPTQPRPGNQTQGTKCRDSLLSNSSFPHHQVQPPPAFLRRSSQILRKNANAPDLTARLPGRRPGESSLALVSPSQPRAPNPPRADSGAAASNAAWTLDSSFFWVYSQGFDCLFRSFSDFKDKCQLGQRSGGPGPGPRASGASVSAKVCLAPQAGKC